MGIFREIGRQMQYPRGWLGKVIFSWMTKSTIGHARWTVDLLGVQPDDEVLEIGFGNGANLKLLQQLAHRGTVTGVEVSATALEMASKKNAAAIDAGRVKLFLAPGGDLPFGDGTFDKACTVATVYVIQDPGAVFAEMYRVLKPGGRAAVTFPVRENFSKFRPVSAEGFYLHELADLEKAFRDAGFIRCSTELNDRARFGAHCLLGEKATTP